MRRKSREDISTITLNKLVAESGYSTSKNNDTIFKQFREQLQFLEDNQKIKIEKPINKVSFNEGIDIQLLELLVDIDFTILTLDEFNTIISSSCHIDNGKFLSVFLYIKSWIILRNVDDITKCEFKDAKDKPEAFFKSIDTIKNDLALSNDFIDKCLKKLVSIDLLKKYETGSYVRNEKRKNAPNIYGFNNDKWQQECEWAVNKLKGIFDVESFDKPIHRYKKKKAKDQVSVDNIKEDINDDKAFEQIIDDSEYTDNNNSNSVNKTIDDITEYLSGKKQSISCGEPSPQDAIINDYNSFYDDEDIDIDNLNDEM